MAITSSALRGLSVWMQTALLELERELAKHGIRVSIYSGLRTASQQASRVRMGHSRAKVSKHQDLDGLGARAADLTLTPAKYGVFRRSSYALAGKIWTKLGGIWGGNFKDPELARAEFQHFEDSSPQPSQQLLSSSSRSRPARRILTTTRSGHTTLPLWYLARRKR